MTARHGNPGRPPSGIYLLGALGLFLVWSNSFIAASYLLGTETADAQMSWVSLAIARFAPILPICLIYCLTAGRRDSLRALRKHPLRLIACGMLGVPAYNLALYYGQENGVPPPIASLTTALVPLFVMLLAAVFLGEQLSIRRSLAFLVAFSGLFVIALSKGDPGEVAAYGLTLAITALAPFSWSIYTILSKPIFSEVSPLVWTYLSIVVGSIPFVIAFPWVGGPELLALTSGGWLAILYLSVLCTALGYAVWTWLLRHLPATTVGFTAFMNPPLTTVNKMILSSLFPAIFVFQVSGLEWLGGALALAGLAMALWPTD